MNDMKYDEGEHLTLYVLNHCTDEMTAEEREVVSYFRMLQKSGNSSGKLSSKLLEKAHQMSTSSNEELINLGEAKFYQLLRDRVLERNPSVVNRCPSCGKVARTPNAKQCPWCFYDWHAA